MGSIFGKWTILFKKWGKKQIHLFPTYQPVLPHFQYTFYPQFKNNFPQFQILFTLISYIHFTPIYKTMLIHFPIQFYPLFNNLLPQIWFPISLHISDCQPNTSIQAILSS